MTGVLVVVNGTTLSKFTNLISIRHGRLLYATMYTFFVTLHIHTSLDLTDGDESNSRVSFQTNFMV